jgi:hypothetical protein
MENKLLVIYVGVLKYNSFDIEEIIEKIVNKIKPSTFMGEVIIIPDYLSANTRIECINPKYITEKDLIKEHTKNMKSLQKKIIEGVKSLENDKII